MCKAQAYNPTQDWTRKSLKIGPLHMKTDSAQLLINRYLDGVATAEEREQLARAMQVDPLLRNEFEDLESIHASTESLFRQLKLPEDFSARVMRRVQNGGVPSDEVLEAVRLPAQRPLGSRPRPVVAHRKRARVYAIMATISAAAALLLAVGVLTGFFARAGIGTQGLPPADKELAEGRQGGPDVEELNRTDSSSLPPSKTDKREERVKNDTPKQPVPVEPKLPEPEPKEVVQPEPAPQDPLPEDVIKQPEPKEPAIPDTPEPEPLPEAKDVVEQPETPEPDPVDPNDTVEDEPKENKTEALPTDRTRIGRMLILNGKAELVDNAGNGKPMTEEQELFAGDRIRTNVNGLVLLQTESGNLTLHRKSEIKLDSSEMMVLQAGTVALDRDNGHAGTDLAITADAYTMYLNHGCAVIERKRRGLTVEQSFGFASISHDEFGTVLLDEQSGHELDVEFGKPVEEPRAKPIRIPDWSAESRAKVLLLALNESIRNREYPAREFSYVEDRLPNRVEKLMRNTVGQDTVVEFFHRVLDNVLLDGGTLILMVSELEAAYMEVSELTPEVITDHAGRAAMVGENFDEWKDYFYRLMRPPVEPKNPPKPVPTKGGSKDCPNECPNDDKLKRVENPPQKKKVVKVPQTPEAEDPAKNEPDEKE